MPETSSLVADALRRAMERRQHRRAEPLVGAFDKTIESMLELLSALQAAPAEVLERRPPYLPSFEVLVADMMMWAGAAQRLVPAHSRPMRAPGAP